MQELKHVHVQIKIIVSDILESFNSNLCKGDLFVGKQHTHTI